MLNKCALSQRFLYTIKQSSKTKTHQLPFVFYRNVSLLYCKMCNEDKTRGRGQWVHYNCNTHPYLPDGHRYREISANRTHFALCCLFFFELRGPACRWRSEGALTFVLGFFVLSWPRRQQFVPRPTERERGLKQEDEF